MAAISITAASIVPDTTSANYNVLTGIAAVTITQGQAVYRLTAGTIGLADANASTPAFTCVGISVSSALAGQPIQYQIAGDLAFGAVLTAGKVYVLGAVAAGDIAPVADLASGWYTNILGYAISTTVLRMNLVATGIVN